jgi:hypothetical protein
MILGTDVMVEKNDARIDPDRVPASVDLHLSVHESSMHP